MPIENRPCCAEHVGIAIVERESDTPMWSSAVAQLANKPGQRYDISFLRENFHLLCKISGADRQFPWIVVQHGDTVIE
jgi:hypothetical protein